MNRTLIGRGVRGLFLAGIAAAAAGCEGWNRQHTLKEVDINPPPIDQLSHERGRPERYSFPDLVEDMMASRQAYVDKIRYLERAYLNSGDTVRANWARRQRMLIEGQETYPYLTAQPNEFAADVAPERSIPEADKLYDEGMSLLNSFRGIPLAGTLPANKKKARNALNLFKRVLKEYPKSDKVDDCAFLCGEIYKEYLREDDPDDELSVRYYQWALALNPATPHPVRFQCAVVHDFRRHDRARALELYHKVLDEETLIDSNTRFAATRIEQLTDEQYSHVRPHDDRTRPAVQEPGPDPITEPAPAAVPEGNAPARVSGTGSNPEETGLPRR